MKKTPFALALAACGLSQAAAAEYFQVALPTIKKWAQGKRRVPPGIWEQLGQLFERIEELADVILEAVEAVEEEGGMELTVELPGQLPGNAELTALARAQMVLGGSFRLHPAPRGEAAEKARLLRLPPLGEA